jgi:hypothetical protein
LTGPKPLNDSSFSNGWFASPLNEPNRSIISSAIHSAGFPLMPVAIKMESSSASVNLSEPACKSFPPGCFQ